MLVLRAQYNVLDVTNNGINEPLPVVMIVDGVLEMTRPALFTSNVTKLPFCKSLWIMEYGA